MLHWIWKLNLSPKIKFFLWPNIRDEAPTCEFLIARMLEITNMCHLCKQNIDHIFKYYPFVQGIYDRMKYNCPTPLFYEGDLLSWLEMGYKNYKINCKIYKHPMEKFSIIL